MKRGALLLLPLLLVAGSSFARTTHRSTADDRAAVRQAVLDYADALYQVDPARIQRSVHPELVKLGFTRSAPGAAYQTAPMSYQELYDLAGLWNADGRVDAATARREVVVLDVLDQTASAKLTAEWGVDYMHLARYNGRWQIIHVLWQSHPPAPAPADPIAEPVPQPVIGAEAVTTPDPALLERLVSAPADGGAYFELLQQARQFHAQAAWPASADAHSRLVAAYPWNGEVWQRLAVARYNSGDFRGAAQAFAMADEQGIQPYPQTNALWAAVSHARAGAVAPAEAWLEIALRRYRYGEAPELRDNRTEAYAALRALPRFDELMPPGPNAALSRDEGWRRDLDVLLSEVRRLNPVYSREPLPDTLARAAARLRERIPQLTDAHVAIEFQHLLSLLGHNHNTYAFWQPGRTVTFMQLPVTFYLFPEGLHVIAAREGFEDLVGARVLRFDDTAAADALAAMDYMVARENPMELVWRGPILLGLPQVLHALGLTRSGDAVELTVLDRTGRTRSVRLAGAAFAGRPKLQAPRIDGLPPAPLYLTRPDDRFWFEPLPRQQALYVQFNQVVDAPGESLAQFGVRLRRVLAASPEVRNLIVDVRRNNGGDTYLYPELLRTLIGFDQQEGTRLAILIGRNTFSATTNLITDLDRLTNAVFVGEPSGGKPLTAGGDESSVVLPWSGLSFLLSSAVWQLTSPRDTRLWITPNVPVQLSARDYFANRDPVLEAALRLVGGN
jgi:tetratricopeptide (TPR) repeat protein